MNCYFDFGEYEHQLPISKSSYEKAKRDADVLLSIGKPIPANFMNDRIDLYEKMKREDAKLEKFVQMRERHKKRKENQKKLIILFPINRFY